MRLFVYSFIHFVLYLSIYSIDVFSQEKVLMNVWISVAMLGPMTWVMYNMKFYTGQAKRDENGKVVWIAAPTFIGSDGKEYYEAEQD